MRKRNIIIVISETMFVPSVLIIKPQAMNGASGLILIFTYIIYCECVDFGGHNETNSGVMDKIMVKKCCPEGQHLLKDTMKCQTPNKQWRNQSFPNIPLYHYVDNDVPVLTEKKFYDVYQIQTSANKTFDPVTWNDYTTTRHILFLSDVSMFLLVLRLLYTVY